VVRWTALLALLNLSLVAIAQQPSAPKDSVRIVDPAEFPELTSLVNVCFYTRENGVNRKVCDQVLRSELSSSIVTVAYQPSATGNPDRNTFVKAPDGSIWFIDYLGASLKIGGQSGKAFVIQQGRVNGSSILLTVPIPPEAGQLQVVRDGQEITNAAGDFTITGNTLNLTLPVTQAWFIIRSPI